MVSKRERVSGLIMKNSRRKNIFLLLLFVITTPLFFLAFFVFWLDMQISINLNGVHGIKIGDAKSDVISKLAENDIIYISPRVEHDIKFNKDNLEDIHKINKPEGVCVTDHKGYALYVSLNDNNDFITDQHGVNKYNDLKDVMTKQEFINWINLNINLNKNMDVWNCITDTRMIDIRYASNMDIVYIMEFNTWFYHVSKSYSSVTLRFKNNHLNNIVYHWRPFESP